MRKIMIYLIIFVLVVSSASFISINKEFNVSATNDPPINKTAKQTWTIQSVDTVFRDYEEFATQDIIIEPGGYMSWSENTIYVLGNFYINGTFYANNSDIYVKGSWQVKGSVDLENVNLIFNTTLPGSAEIRILNGGYMNITDSKLNSTHTTFGYNFSYEAGSSGLIESTHIYDCGVDTGLIIKTNDVEIEGCTFKDNYNHIDVQDANPRVKNSTFHGGAHVSNSNVVAKGTSIVHIISCKNLNTSTECQVLDTAELFEDYFVIVRTENSSFLGVGFSNIEFTDKNQQTIVNVITDNTTGPNKGHAQPVRITKKRYTNANWPAGDYHVNPYTVTASDPWDEIKPVPTQPLNASVNTPAPADQIIYLTFTFYFKPMIDIIPPSVAVTEDENLSHSIKYHDHDYWSTNPEELAIDFNTSFVYYEKSSHKLYFNYPNGQPATSVVNVTITDFNTNKAYADIPILYTPENDAPKVNMTQNFDVWEDHAIYLPVELKDIDTLLTNVNVYTNQKDYFTFIPSNNTMKVLYTNDFGADQKQDNVLVWAYDGEDNSSTDWGDVELLVTFYQTPDAPIITKNVPPQKLDEDSTPIKFDLSTYWQDDDYDADPKPETKPGWYVTGYTKSSVKVSNDTFEMEITPNPNAFGNEQVTLYLEDAEGLSDSVQFWINITQKQDEPFIQNPTFIPEQEEAGETFTFYVDYVDIENEAPSYVKLKIDDEEYDMTEDDSTDQNYADGKKYKVAVQLFIEDHDYSFVISDGTTEVITPVFKTKWPKLINILRIATKWSANKEFMVKIGYYSKLGGTITINENPTQPGNDTYPLGNDDVGFFYGVSSNIKNIQWVYMKFDITMANLTDTYVNEEEVKLRYYDPGSKDWNLTFNAMNQLDNGARITSSNITMSLAYIDLESEVIFAPIGPVDDDIDDDGTLNNEDAFPFDPLEWEDSDDDGIGDNADKFDHDPCVSKDEDNDGAPDEWMPGCNGSTVDPDLYLDEYPLDPDCSRDFDEDGICDEDDKDDDNDTMPDLYEKQYEFLNPYDPSDAELDYDGDGATNKREYEYGTDPSDNKDAPPPPPKGDEEQNYLLTVIALIIIIVLILIVAVFVMRKPKKEEEAEEAPAVMAPAEQPYYPPPAVEGEVTPAVPPPPEQQVLEPVPPEAPEQLPEAPGEGEAPAEEAQAQPPAPGTGYVVDESQAEQMVPESAEVIAEGEVAAEAMEGETEEHQEEEFEDEEEE